MLDYMTDEAYDLSKLFRAWERHYEAIGLGAFRARGLAIKKTRWHKAPPGYTFEQLARRTQGAYRG